VPALRLQFREPVGELIKLPVAHERDGPDPGRCLVGQRRQRSGRVMMAVERQSRSACAWSAKRLAASIASTLS
jgi:hypothetical protein